MFPKEQLSHFSLSAGFFSPSSVGCVFVCCVCSVRNGGIHAVSSASAGTRQPIGALRRRLRLSRSQPRAHGPLGAAPRQAARRDGDVPRLSDHPVRPPAASHHLHQGSRACEHAKPASALPRISHIPPFVRPSTTGKLLWRGRHVHGFRGGRVESRAVHLHLLRPRLVSPGDGGRRAQGKLRHPPPGPAPVGHHRLHQPVQSPRPAANGTTDRWLPQQFDESSSKLGVGCGGVWERST